MPGKLLAEIKQTRPFASAELEAYLNLARTADQLAREVAAVLKPHDLTATHYNVLRILRGAGEGGLPCGEIAARLVAHDPDVTRLVDRLERRDLVTRVRDAKDRRVVTIRLTAAGAALAEDAAIDEALLALHRRQFATLTSGEVATLIDLLERSRERP